ncbi:unnamed protein product [Caenorhabditis sp. 36 PRJEB53466]|nr:unnamed protein product [Caenorhabditis sp. 36 PRJEB53466]
MGDSEAAETSKNTENAENVEPQKIEKIEKEAENVENPKKPDVPEEKVKFFKTKKIRFGPLEYQIVTQNLNGPCPLIAIVNALVLKGKIEIPSKPLVTSKELLTHLTNIILSRTPSSNAPEIVEIFENNLRDVLNIIDTIVNGLDVNVKFSGVDQFEFTPALSLFDLVVVNLYHVWLPDPQFRVVYDLVKNLNYNELVLKMCGDETDEAQLLRNFHEESISQITFHGLASLLAKMADAEIAVVFQNNHFSTILKRRDEIFKLVSDEGLADEKNVVWETFNSVDGDSIFVNGDFGNFRPTPQTTPPPIDNSPIEEAVEAVEMDRPSSVPIPMTSPNMQRSRTSDEIIRPHPSRPLASKPPTKCAIM